VSQQFLNRSQIRAIAAQQVRGKHVAKLMRMQR
jgi:hypothetical protein